MSRRPRTLLRTAVPLATGVWLLWRVQAPQAEGATRPARSPGRRAPARPAPPRPGDPAGESRPTVSVIVPARDEEASLPRLLASLATQTRPADEVIVVDDHSSDATAALARAGGATVLAAPELRAGWVGKTAACATGARRATGDVLAFVDADVTFAPDALARLVDEHRRRGGIVSVQPRHDTVAAYEQLSAVCNLVVMMGTGAFTGWPHPDVDMAFGPCLLVGRDDYEMVGGHDHPSVRAQVAEDIAIARRVRAAGRPVTVLAGGDVVRFRMYPGGLRRLVEGWTKMLGTGLRQASPAVGLAVAVWVTGALVAAGRGAAALTALRRGRRRAGTAADVAVYGAWVAEMAWLLPRVGRWRRMTAVAFPVPLAAFVLFTLRGVTLVVTGRPATWRGRSVPAR
jgi:4,4'-diaponeurosporenoate glycosyltransferase